MKRERKPVGKVKAVFVTSTTLSPRAQDFADFLGIETETEKKYDRDYPMIKCNVGQERIYHLPFDQQYDTAVIKTEKGECYVRTTAEAEAKGFRRAYRWSGVGGGVVR
jgi:hypothetical protein